MKLLALLVSYLGIAAALFGGVVAGVIWLVKPDPNAPAPAPRVAPIAPRIAESIERKKAATPVMPVTAAHASEATIEPEPNKPVMHEAPAALTPAPRIRIRELKPPRVAKHKLLREQRSIAAQEAAPPAEPAAGRPIATARTDSPY